MKIAIINNEESYINDNFKILCPILSTSALDNTLHYVILKEKIDKK